MPIRERIEFDDDPAQESLDRLEAALEEHAKRLQKVFGGVSKSGKRSAEEIEKSGTKGARRVEKAHTKSAKRIEAAWARVKTVIAGVFTSIIVGGLVKLNAEMERTEVAFRTMLGSAGAARTVLKDLFTFTEQTPFQFDQVADAGRILLAFGSDVKNLKDELRILGDIASGTNQPLGELASIFGKARINGRLFAEDINQLQDRGIPIIGELAKRFGVAEKQIRKMVEGGKLGFSDLLAVMRGLTSEGGRFFGLMEAQSQTFLGILSTLRDVGTATLREVGEGVFTELKGDLVSLRDRLNDLRQSGDLSSFARKLGQAIRDVFVEGKRLLGLLIRYGPALAAVTSALVGWRLGAMAVRSALAVKTAAMVTARAVMLGYRAATLLVAAAQALLTANIGRARAAMVLLNRTIRTNPVGLLVSLLSAGAAALLFFRSQSEDAASAQEHFAEKTRDAIEAIQEMNGALLRNEKLSLESRRREVNNALDAIEARRRQAERKTFEPLLRQVGPGESQVVLTAEQRRALELRRLEEERRSLLRESVSLRRRQEEIEHRLTNDLTARIEYLEAERAALIATGEETEELKRVNQELTTLYKRQDELRAAGLSPDGPSLGGGKLTERIQKLQAERDALVEQGEATERLAEVNRELVELLAKRTRLQEFGTKASQVVEGLTKLAPRALDLIPKDEVARVNGMLDDFNRKMTELKNSLSLGDLSEQQFFDAVGEASGRLIEKLTRDLTTLMTKAGTISPEIAKAFQEVFDAAERGADEAKDGIEGASKGAAALVSDLGNMASAARSLTRLVDFFGDVNDEVRALLEGTADVLDNLDRLSKVRAAGGGALAQAVPILGVVTGAATILGGIFSGFRDSNRERAEEIRRQNEEMQRLRDALRDNARKISDAVRELATQAQIGRGISGEQASRARSLAEQLRNLIGSDAGFDTLPEPARSRAIAELQRVIRDILKQLEETGIDAFQNISELFLNAPGGSISEKLRNLFSGFDLGGDTVPGLNEILDLLGNLGGFSDTVSGAIDQLRLFTEFLGLEGNEALRGFVEALGGVDGISDELRKLLDEAGVLDVTTAEGRARLDEIIATIASLATSGDLGFLGGLTPGDIDALLGALKGFAGSGGGPGTGTSRSAVFQRSITEVQANEVAFYLEEIAHWTKLTAMRLEALTVLPSARLSALGVRVSRPGGFTAGLGMPEIDAIRAHLGARLGATMPGPDSGFGSITVNIGSIEASGISEAEARAIVEAEASQMMRRIKHRVDQRRNRAF